MFAFLNGFDYALYSVGHHYTVFYDLGLLYHADNIAGNYVVSCLYFRLEVPLLLVVERRHIHAPVNSVTAGFDEFCQRTLNTVVNTRDNSGTEFYAQRSLGGYDLFSRTQTARLFVYLYGSSVVSQLDDFADEVVFAYSHHVEHLAVTHSFRYDKRS